MKEVDREYVKNLPKGSKYYVFNPYSQMIKEEKASKKDIAHNKYAVFNLKYYIEEEKEKNG